MNASIELPTRHTNANGDDDYHNAVLGVDTYNPPARNEATMETVDMTTSRQPTSGLSKPQKKSGLGGASANLVNSIVGAGIIGIPYALKQSGLLAGLALLVLVSYLTGESISIGYGFCVINVSERLMNWALLFFAILLR